MNKQKNKQRYVAYYRVSTQKQDKEMPAQKTAVKNFLKNSYPPVKSFTEVESGSNNNRPELFNALNYCADNNCKLVVAKLDRLSRDLEFIASLQKSNVEFVCADMPEANSLTISLLACLAQWERDQIAKRTKLALAEKKKQGIKLGYHNPVVKRAVDKKARELRRLRVRKQKKSLKLKHKNIKPTKISKRQLADNLILPALKALRSSGSSYVQCAIALNQSGNKTRWGRQWTHTQLHKIAHRNNIA